MSITLPQLKHFDCHEDRGAIVLKFRERKILNVAVIYEAGRELLGLLDCAWPRIVINFENVDFLASEMLGEMIKLEKKCKQKAVLLRFCRIIPEIYEVFAITRLHKLFVIRETMEQALADESGA